MRGHEESHDHEVGGLLFSRGSSAMDQVIGGMFSKKLLGLSIDKAQWAPIEEFLHCRWGPHDSELFSA